MRRPLPLLLALTFPALAQDFAAKADEFVQSWVRDQRFRGSVLVAKDGVPVFRKSYGNANDEWDVANTPDTKFRLGSITKQFTAVAIMQLVEKNKLKLDDPIKTYYTDAPAAWDKITIHHLLCHTSGIPSYTGLRDFFPKHSRDPLKPAEIVKLTQDKPLEFEPGAKFAYNNTGYILLGYVIEKVAGESYASYVRKNLLDPLGMKDSGYDTFADVLKKRATGYSPNGRHAPYLDMTLPYAAGSLYSTVDDLLKWEQAMNTEKLISKASFEKMTTPNLSGYGYGLAIGQLAGKPSQGHGGGINGFNTMLLRIPSEKITTIVLANQEGPAEPIANALTRLYLGEDVKPRPVITEIKLPTEKLDAFAGSYAISPTFVLKIWRDGARMLTQATGQGQIEIVPIAENRFYARGPDAQLEFHRDESGKVNSATLHQGGRSTPAKRIAD